MPSIFSPQFEIGWMPHLDLGGSPLIAGSINLDEANPTSILVSCNSPSGGDGSYSYQWYYGTSSLAEGEGTTFGTDSTSATASGLTPGTTYHFRVRVTDGYGTVAYSDDASFSTDAEGAGGSPTPYLLFEGLGFYDEMGF